MRLFIAVPLPREVAQAASALLPRLPALRPVAPELMHVTLVFIGNVPHATLDRIVTATRPASARNPFDVVLDRVGRFPSNGPPTVVWVGIGKGAAELADAASRVRDELAKCRVPFDAKPFRPHVTLARVRDRARSDDVRDVTAALANATAAHLEFRADGVVVVESTTTRAGPRYTPRATLPFAVGDRPAAPPERVPPPR